VTYSEHILKRHTWKYVNMEQHSTGSHKIVISFCSKLEVELLQHSGGQTLKQSTFSLIHILARVPTERRVYLTLLRVTAWKMRRIMSSRVSTLRSSQHLPRTHTYGNQGGLKSGDRGGQICRLSFYSCIVSLVDWYMGPLRHAGSTLGSASSKAHPPTHHFPQHSNRWNSHLYWPQE
jgi:hypothetical protein